MKEPEVRVADRGRQPVHGGGSIEPEAGAPAPVGSRWPSRSVRRLVKIAPSTAVPIEPPVDRKSVADEVATPSSS